MSIRPELSTAPGVPGVRARVTEPPTTANQRAADRFFAQEIRENRASNPLENNPLENNLAP
jgi:hypothetical protein